MKPSEGDVFFCPGFRPGIIGKRRVKQSGFIHLEIRTSKRIYGCDFRDKESSGHRLFVVLCRYPHKNQRSLELKIALSIENDEEPASANREKLICLQVSPITGSIRPINIRITSNEARSTWSLHKRQYDLDYVNLFRLMFDEHFDLDSFGQDIGKLGYEEIG